MIGTDDGNTGSTRRAKLLSRLSRQQTLTTGLMDRISDLSNLADSFQRVKRNGGSAGIDGVSIEAYHSNLIHHLNRLHTDLLAGKYQPQAVRGVQIPKPNGGSRQLGIPTVADRVVQESIQKHLQPIYEPYFSENSYGFRPGRNAQQAIGKACSYVADGKVWVVDIDLESFFDRIPHDRLMSRLSKSISDKRVLRLIHAYLKAGLMQDGLCSQRISGTPQGGPLSPLLSNIVLDELDKELEKRGLSFVRYADDCNIYVKSRRSAERVLLSVSTYLQETLKLKVNWEKSGVREVDQVKFLGHTLLKDGRVRISDASIKRLKTKVRELTKRNQGKRTEVIIDSLNRVIQGWSVYYRRCNAWLTNLRDLDGWIRKRLRCYILKQHQRRYPTYRFLRELGAPPHWAWSVVMHRGWWAQATHRTSMTRMSIRWFQEKGLRSLEAVQKG